MPPSTKFIYSDMGFIVLGALVHLREGTILANLLDRHAEKLPSASVVKIRRRP